MPKLSKMLKRLNIEVKHFLEKEKHLNLYSLVTDKWEALEDETIHPGYFIRENILPRTGRNGLCLVDTKTYKMIRDHPYIYEAHIKCLNRRERVSCFLFEGVLFKEDASLPEDTIRCYKFNFVKPEDEEQELIQNIGELMKLYSGLVYLEGKCENK